MSIPLFTHQCGGCRPPMDLHPALRDYHACEHRADAPDARPERAEHVVGSVFRRRWMVTVCAACASLVLGSLVVF